MTTASTDTPSIRERLDRLRPAVLEVAQRYWASLRSWSDYWAARLMWQSPIRSIR
jgi:hypothetical protein